MHYLSTKFQKELKIFSTFPNIYFFFFSSTISLLFISQILIRNLHSTIAIFLSSLRRFTGSYEGVNDTIYRNIIVKAEERKIITKWCATDSILSGKYDASTDETFSRCRRCRKTRGVDKPRRAVKRTPDVKTFAQFKSESIKCGSSRKQRNRKKK